MNDRSRSGMSPASAGSVVSLGSEPGRGHKRIPSSRELRIPELYRRPMGDREMQGCLKARA